MVFGIILVKLGVIVLTLVLPFGLAISLGAGDSVALLVLLVEEQVTQKPPLGGYGVTPLTAWRVLRTRARTRRPLRPAR